jgi:hypothetical protein
VVLHVRLRVGTLAEAARFISPNPAKRVPGTVLEQGHGEQRQNERAEEPKKPRNQVDSATDGD